MHPSRSEAGPHAPNRRRLVVPVAVGLVVAGVAAACSFPPAEPGAPGLVTVDDWVAGRSKIWDIAFPQGVAPARSTPRTTPGIDLRPVEQRRDRPARSGGSRQFDGAFDTTGEGGLMGIALSPGFNARPTRRAFVCYSTTTDNRVARFDVELRRRRRSAGITNWTPIVTGLPHASFHNGCRVRFQPGTGALFVSTGDGATATGAAVDDRARRQDPAHRPERQPVARATCRARAGTRAGTATRRASRSARDERSVLDRARPRRQRRGQQARQRRQRRVEPEQRHRRLRPVEADDRPVARSRQHDDAGVAVGRGRRSRRRAARSSRARSGRAGTARSWWRASTAVPTSASACSSCT